jgi:hypothetical protein
MEETNGDEQSSLLQYGIGQDRKKVELNHHTFLRSAVI